MKFLLTLSGLGLGVYLVFTVALYFFQEKMLFFPGPGRFGFCPIMESRGARAVQSGQLRYYLQEKAASRGWIIVFHGNAGTACDRVYFLDLFSTLPVNLVLFEYPGYGRDTAAPGEALFLSQAEALVSHIRTINTGHRPVYLLGESIGTGVATYVAAQIPVDGLILLSSYTSIADVAQYHYPWLPVGRLLKHRFEARQWAEKVRSPVIMFHGRRDDIIPIQFAREQQRNFKNSVVQFFEIEACGHNDLIDVGKDLLIREVQAFLDLSSDPV